MEFTSQHCRDNQGWFLTQDALCVAGFWYAALKIILFLSWCTLNLHLIKNNTQHTSGHAVIVKSNKRINKNSASCWAALHHPGVDYLPITIRHSITTWQYILFLMYHLKLEMTCTFSSTPDVLKINVMKCTLCVLNYSEWDENFHYSIHFKLIIIVIILLTDLIFFFY